MALLYLLLLPWRQVCLCRSTHARIRHLFEKKNFFLSATKINKGCGDQFNNCFKVVVVVGVEVV